MKKHILLLPAILLIVQLAQAQKPDATVAIVRYTFSHIRDTTNKAKVYTENMELLIGKNGSVYRSADKRLMYEQMKKQLTEQVNAGATNINMGGKANTSNTEYYQFQAEKKLVIKEKFINDYLVEEALPNISWKITADTTSFGTLHCQKATAVFKGRIYEAWFCPALPFRSGPWKLNGLPGLIVEASDSKKEVVFKFAGLEDASKIIEATQVSNLPQENNTSGKGIQILGLEENSSSKTISLPASGIKATEKEIAQLKETMRKDPAAFVQATMAAAGSNLKFISTTPVQTNTVIKNPINNPIELTDKP